ncbi:hypothetical protein GV829_00265 [Sphingomonas lacunae]|uniref:Uncharacterized protein n=1 Tax=Sphingomonas lacunae TaxID=2698828 RepID=A0A6M4APW5_9SPHN|nr:hypothetical protein [Sphingomonas lacunae]QJQ31078.1 hypothetical protein GV829_00265 [Sphingomonas lacunae]
MTKYIFILFLACSGYLNQSQQINNVSYQEYLNIPKCWSTSEGDIQAILILVENKTEVFTNFVSVRCYTSIQGRDNTINVAINALKIIDDKGFISENGLSYNRFISNTVDDLDGQWDKAKIFAFKGKIARISVAEAPDGVFYTIESVEIVKKLNINFEQFSDITPDKRRELYCDSIFC